MLHELVVGIKMQVANDRLEACGHIALEQPEEAKTHRHAQRRGDKLEPADDLGAQGP